MTGIAGIGAYAPSYRLAADEIEDTWGTVHASGVSQTAVPDADEDTLTMAYEAATRALKTAGIEGDAVTGLTIGTTNPPYEEEAMAPRLTSMLGLSTDIPTRQLEGSTRVGVDALVAGRQIAVDGDGVVLAIGTDAPRGAPEDAVEQAAGAGAAAVLLSAEGTGSVGKATESVVTYPGTRFREGGAEETTGLGVTEYDRSAYRETIVAAADTLDAELGDADAVAIQSPDGALPYRVADDLGVDTEAIQAGTTVHDLGDTGAAGPLLGLAHAVDTGHTTVAVVGYGSGGGATVVWVDGDRVPVETGLEGDRQLAYGEYLRMRGEITTGEPAGGGAYVSVPTWRRSIPQRHRLVAGRCPDCGELAFPPEGACGSCGDIPDYDTVELEGTGTVEAATTIGQGGAPPEFVEQQARSGSYVSAIVAFDGPDGEPVSVPVQVIPMEAESVDIGDQLMSTIRRIYTQEGVARYGVKMVPDT